MKHYMYYSITRASWCIAYDSGNESHIVATDLSREAAETLLKLYNGDKVSPP